MEDEHRQQAAPGAGRTRPRRRTALVTSRWAASAAVIAAMTAGAATTDGDGPTDQTDVTVAYADPPEVD